MPYKIIQERSTAENIAPRKLVLELPANAANESDWKVFPFSKPKTTSIGKAIEKPHITELFKGTIPRDMDDRWFIYANVLDARHATINFHRSWTGFKVLQANLELSSSDGVQLFVKDILWESDHDRCRFDEAEARSTFLNLFQVKLL